MKAWPKEETETVDFCSMVDPLAELLHDNYRQRFKKEHLPQDFSKFLDVGLFSRATTPPPAETLTVDGLAYHKERGRDLIDVVLAIAVQYGIEQGRRMVHSDQKMWLTIADRALKNNDIDSMRMVLERLTER